MWADDLGNSILIGDEDCKRGDLIIIVKLDRENVLEWIKALVTMLDDGTIISLPGEVGKCSAVKE